ncbi:MAG: Xaa-Pro peptidase family protein [Litorilinea sp.]
MRSDLDRLMAAREIDAFLVMGDSGGNPIMHYLTGGVHLENAIVLKRRGGPLTLIHGAMERDSAARTGLALVNRDSQYNQYQLVKKHAGDRLAAAVDYLTQVINDHDLDGRIGVYGQLDAGAAYTLFRQLEGALPTVNLVGEYGDSLFSQARETKDDQEIAELVEAGRRTSLVVGEVQEFIQSHTVRDETVYKDNGDPLTIGDVKAFMRSRFMVHDLREDHDTIFSQGRDAGVPHNSGNLEEPLQLGKSIIFDIFPTVPSGYFHDMTRTWSLGYATDEVQLAYEQTLEIFHKAMGALQLGTPCRDYQVMTCEFYEALGHPTPRSHPGTQEGYVHSLGHGIGLDIHEEPRLSHGSGGDVPLQPGHVFSVEPGLYYPDKGYGVRVEDSVAFNEAGELILLTRYPHDLIVPMPRA